MKRLDVFTPGRLAGRTAGRPAPDGRLEREVGADSVLEAFVLPGGR